MERIAYIRQKEKEYHETCYKEHELFQSGSWLHKPVAFVLEVAEKLDKPLRILDLGCGVGRHSIPLAKYGSVDCVDLLPIALEKLMEYGNQHNVAHKLTCMEAEIDTMHIEENTYDYIVAISSLEHVSSEAVLRKFLRRMKVGTRANGMHYFVVNSNIEETDVLTGVKLEPLLEVNMKTEDMLALLDDTYRGWTSIKREVKHLQFTIQRDKQDIHLKTDAITYVVQRS
ncbi:class I SAM-dependent methyltransferase [Priestia taiwanensis]|uniref:Methyltransferase n=1 Tax=Priestia taiwanensis TaxID=1347902 RepID=A0A917EQ91_9BACI|nr:class I SAM-dependent methyltransferase [Priestia taiwanensis]MBM7363968.1 2-polyprenyl-3-methyl-5-hydroxy-6-metoxy-1,4-benzoquinol methylase [Priestia taiwanensis]GGE70572.1 methyltransferase [Priestia taiwanensis]